MIPCLKVSGKYSFPRYTPSKRNFYLTNVRCPVPSIDQSLVITISLITGIEQESVALSRIESCKGGVAWRRGARIDCATCHEVESASSVGDEGQRRRRRQLRFRTYTHATFDKTHSPCDSHLSISDRELRCSSDLTVGGGNFGAKLDRSACFQKFIWQWWVLQYCERCGSFWIYFLA